MKLFEKQNNSKHTIYKLLGIKIKLKHSEGITSEVGMFLERNLKENAKMRLYGWWDGYRSKHINDYFRDEFFAYFLLKEKIKFHIFKKLTIPQVEFVLTTNCTLKCKNCSNFIPSIKDKYTMSLEEFKNNVDALSKGCNEIQTTLLLGGEPLLNKNLPAMVDYISKNKKFKTIYIVTNATLMFSEELIDAIKKYKNKVRVYISNYSINKELENRLKTEKIIDVLDKNQIGHYTIKDLKWREMSPCKKLHLSQEEVVKRFINCKSRCVQIYKQQMHVCPISTLCEIKKWFNFDKEGQEYIYLEANAKRSSIKTNLIKFYERAYFEACDWCPNQCGREVIPAEQLRTERDTND